MTQPAHISIAQEERGADSEVTVRLKNTNKWVLSPLHQRERFAKNESLNSLIEFYQLFSKVNKLFRSFEAAQSVDSGTLAALSHVTLDIERGMAAAVVDPDAIGKHALIQLVGQAGLPNGGSVQTAGRVVNLGILTSLIIPSLTARENLALLSELIGVMPAELDAAVSAALELTASSNLLDLPVRRIGVRAFTELALATVVCLPFDVLVAEEILPTRHPQLRTRLMERYRENLSNGQTILFSSRNFDPIAELSTHLILIKNGTVIEHGPTNQLMSLHDDWIEDALDSAAAAQADQITSFDALDDDDFEEEAYPDEAEVSILDDQVDYPPHESRAAQEPKRPAGPPKRTPRGKLRKADYMKLGSLDYDTREIESCRLVEGPRDPVMFGPDAAPLERMRQGERRPKVVDVDAPLTLRFTLETTRPGLRLLPMIDIFANHMPAVRSRPQAATVLGEPGRLSVSVEVPANLLAERFYVIHLAVLVQDDGDEGFADVMIHRFLDFFDARHGGPTDQARDGATPPAKAGPETLPILEARHPWQLEQVAPLGLVEARSIVLGDATGNDLLSHQTGAPGADLPSVVPLRAAVAVEVSRGGLLLSATAELWIGRILCVRIESATILRAEAAGQYRLTTVIPAELLLDHHYRLTVRVAARDPYAGEFAEASHCPEARFSFDAVAEADRAVKGPVPALDCISPPITCLSLPWHIEVLSMDALRPVP